MNFSLQANSRTNDIIVQQVNDEVLIYDLKSNQALSLNQTAAKIWQSLDGKKSVSEIAEINGIPPEMVLLSLDDLKKKNLLSDVVETGLANDTISRRRLMMKLASTAVALPIIVAIAAPKAAQAASCLPNGPSPDVGASGACADLLCPSVCHSFDTRCCSGNSVYTGTCVDNGGGAGVFTCSCDCA